MLAHARNVFRKLIRPFVASLLVTVTFATASPAQEKIATYPMLPTGYSSIKVFDREGRFVGRILPTQRSWVTIDRSPPVTSS